MDLGRTDLATQAQETKGDLRAAEFFEHEPLSIIDDIYNAANSYVHAAIDQMASCLQEDENPQALAEVRRVHEPTQLLAERASDTTQRGVHRALEKCTRSSKVQSIRTSTSSSCKSSAYPSSQRHRQGAAWQVGVARTRAGTRSKTSFISLRTSSSPHPRPNSGK